MFVSIMWQMSLEVPFGALLSSELSLTMTEFFLDDVEFQEPRECMGEVQKHNM